MASTKPSDSHTQSSDVSTRSNDNLQTASDLSKPENSHLATKTTTSVEITTSLPTLSLDRPAAGGTTRQTIKVDGENRDYSVHVPSGWDGKTPLPVLYYFNGLSPGKPEKESFTGLSEKSDQYHYLLVYAKGDGPAETYNNGQQIFNNGKPEQNESDYLNAIHNKLQSTFPIDQTRQGLAGFSQGGSEAFDLASKNKWVSSVQTVEGYTSGYEQPLNRTISAQLINAAHDLIVPIGGTPATDAVALLGLTFMPIPVSPAIIENLGNYIQPQNNTVKNYVKADKIVGPGKTSKVGDVSTTIYTNPDTGAEVNQIVLGSGTHGWAGSKDHSGDIPIIGVPNEEIDASDKISQFFLKHQLNH